MRSPQTIPIRLFYEPVLLLQKLTQLNEIQIFGNRRQYIKVESDKTTVSVKDNGMLNSGNALDAVKRLPGVVASPVGGLTLNSKNVIIYIDGAPSSLTGTDLQNYLASLPAKAIEKVELIYNPGAAFDANASGSIINIVTASKRMKGVNASFNINYNFNKYQKPSPQILMNGKEKNLSWQTMLGYNYIDTDQIHGTDQDFTSFTPVKTLSQRNYTVNTFRNLYFRSGVNYKLTEKSNLLFNYNLNLGNNRGVTEASTIGEGINYENNGITKDKNNVHELSLQYKTKLDTLGRTLDITAYSNFFKRNPINEATAFEDNAFSYNNGNINFDLKNYYLKYDFSFPFEKIGFAINTGGKYNITKVNDLGKYNINSNNSGIFGSGNYASVINFDYTENNLAFYAEARQKVKKFNFTAGLRYENYDVERASSTLTDKIKYVNNNFFPSVNVMYEATKDINFIGSFSKKIAQPGYNQIDPNNSNAFDKYNTSEGDIALKPVYFDNYELKMSAFNYVQIGANYTVAKDKSMFVFSAKDGELVANQTSKSFDKISTFSAFANFPIPLDYFFKGKEEFMRRVNTIDKMNYIFININYAKNNIDGFDFKYSTKGNFNYAAQAQLLLPWNITNTMNYFYLPKGNWEIYHIEKPIQQFDISFNKDFLNKNLKIGLHCFDVFNQNEVHALIAGKNLDTRFYEKQDSRTFRISLTYNFGNLKLEKEETNINTDKVNQGGGGLK
ncbi:TonB-dependent receptor domain-containing protein [Flavobacterium sp. 3HN19-14]|uniref:TonB-dependent receptor domain-containing protein n=1 Tax=Flavobacterium sp. 3HN19-14 TaxID=3448133 RepID=UPI003EE3CF6B